MDIKKFLLLVYECTQIDEKQITFHINCCFYFTCFLFTGKEKGAKNPYSRQNTIIPEEIILDVKVVAAQDQQGNQIMSK